MKRVKRNKFLKITIRKGNQVVLRLEGINLNKQNLYTNLRNKKVLIGVIINDDYIELTSKDLLEINSLEGYNLDIEKSELVSEKFNVKERLKNTTLKSVSENPEGELASKFSYKKYFKKNPVIIGSVLVLSLSMFLLQTLKKEPQSVSASETTEATIKVEDTFKEYMKKQRKETNMQLKEKREKEQEQKEQEQRNIEELKQQEEQSKEEVIKEEIPEEVVQEVVREEQPVEQPKEVVQEAPVVQKQEAVYSPKAFYINGATIYYENIGGGADNSQAFIDSNPNMACTSNGLATYSHDNGGTTHFAGHNPGAFSPILGLGVGSSFIITDSSGVPRNYVVSNVLDVTMDEAVNRYDYLTQSNYTRLVLQTCITPDAQNLRFVEAVPQ